MKTENDHTATKGSPAGRSGILKLLDMFKKQNPPYVTFTCRKLIANNSGAEKLTKYVLFLTK